MTFTTLTIIWAGDLISLSEAETPCCAWFIDSFLFIFTVHLYIAVVDSIHASYVGRRFVFLALLVVFVDPCPRLLFVVYWWICVVRVGKFLTNGCPCRCAPFMTHSFRSCCDPVSCCRMLCCLLRPISPSVLTVVLRCRATVDIHSVAQVGKKDMVSWLDLLINFACWIN